MSAVIKEASVNHIEARRKSQKERKTALGREVAAQAEAQAGNIRKSPKKRALIRLLQERWPDYQPVVEMAEKAMKLSQIADQRQSDGQAQMDAVNAHEKVAKYVTPQLKAMDVTSGGDQIQFGFQLNLANVVEK